MRAKLPYIQRFTDRTGVVRYYFRRHGARVALPDPNDNWPAFLTAYQRAASGKPSGPPAGTMAALIAEYLASADYRDLKPASKATYRHALEFLRSRDSINAPVSAVRREAVVRLRDSLIDTPGKANLVLRVVKMLFAFAVERGYIESNPTLRIKPVKAGEHRSWTDAELLTFENHWPRGTTERLIYEIARHTGQRRDDIARMTWGAVSDGEVYVKQAKTGVEVWIPQDPSLAAELALVKRRATVIITTPQGRPYKPNSLGGMFADAIKRAGLPDDCVLHGLRKARARTLAEAGASEREIMAVTGHLSSSMVSLYTKHADRKRLARSAMDRVAEHNGAVDLSNSVKRRP